MKVFHNHAQRKQSFTVMHSIWFTIMQETHFVIPNYITILYALYLLTNIYVYTKFQNVWSSKVSSIF